MARPVAFERRGIMDDRVELKHPQGKKPVSMKKETYDLLKAVFLKSLREEGEATLAEVVRASAAELKRGGTTFEGSLPWHLEWVKLDLEARNLIKRIPGTPQKYGIAG
jgi:hypothetical protein